MDHTARAKILIKCEDLIKLLNINLNHFPKHEKYALCNEIRNAVYEVYALLVESQKRYHNKTSLSRLDIRHEQLRMFINLAFSLGYFDYHHSKRTRSETEALRRYTAISILVNELGKMIGGWINKLKDEK